ncbi:hypothetical protein PTI98_012992 [Pleurotus ostreatus]|nr:hypothetical protein PTI98_012992 [Pleurotus ostreatus]
MNSIPLTIFSKPAFYTSRPQPHEGGGTMRPTWHQSPCLILSSLIEPSHSHILTENVLDGNPASIGFLLRHSCGSVPFYASTSRGPPSQSVPTGGTTPSNASLLWGNREVVPSPPVREIVGGVLGGVMFVALLGIVIVFLHRRCIKSIVVSSPIHVTAFLRMGMDAPEDTRILIQVSPHCLHVPSSYTLTLYQTVLPIYCEGKLSLSAYHTLHS